MCNAEQLVAKLLQLLEKRSEIGQLPNTRHVASLGGLFLGLTLYDTVLDLTDLRADVITDNAIGRVLRQVGDSKPRLCTRRRPWREASRLAPCADSSSSSFRWASKNPAGRRK